MNWSTVQKNYFYDLDNSFFSFRTIACIDSYFYDDLYYYAQQNNLSKLFLQCGAVCISDIDRRCYSFLYKIAR